MSALYIILNTVVIIACIASIALILAQKKRTAGLSGAVGGMGSDQTYFDKNKARTLEGTMEKYAKISAAVFMILSLALNIVR